MSDIDKNIVAMKDGQRAGTALDAVEAELDKRDKALDRQVFMILGSSEKTLDPQLAVQLWAEKHAIFKLRQGLLQKERVGQSAAQRLTPDMRI